MPARLVTNAVTIAATITVTMMLGRSMSSEGARFSNGKFGRGDKSYSAHSCLRKTWQACLEAYLSSAKRACLEGCRCPERQNCCLAAAAGAARRAVWRAVWGARRTVWIARKLSGAPGGLSGAPGRLVWPAWSTPGCAAERQEG